MWERECVSEQACVKQEMLPNLTKLCTTLYSTGITHEEVHRDIDNSLWYLEDYDSDVSERLAKLEDQMEALLRKIEEKLLLR